MSAQPLATLTMPSLAQTVDETLAGALAGHCESCLWCGSGPVRVTSFNIWTGEVRVVCAECGSELSGVVPRHRIEVSA